MVISSSKYIVGTEEVNGNLQIAGVNRTSYMTQEYLRLVSDYLKSIRISGKVALLIAAGPAIHHSENRVVDDEYVSGSVVIKSQLGYSTYAIAKALGVDFEYININGNTCASSAHSVNEAYSLIHRDDYDHVVVVAMEQTEASQLLLFKQLNIELKCGDGLAIAVFSKEAVGAEITSTAFTWYREGHPMYVSKDGYVSLINKLVINANVNIVKTHGTGTGVNEIAERDAIAECFNDVKVLGYKDRIGHTQGASSLIELLMLVEDMTEGDSAVVLASGLGGFYGGCTVSK